MMLWYDLLIRQQLYSDNQLWNLNSLPSPYLSLDSDHYAQSQAQSAQNQNLHLLNRYCHTLGQMASVKKIRLVPIASLSTQKIVWWASISIFYYSQFPGNFLNYFTTERIKHRSINKYWKSTCRKPPSERTSSIAKPMSNSYSSKNMLPWCWPKSPNSCTNSRWSKE